MLRELVQEPRELVVAHTGSQGKCVVSSAASRDSATGGSVNPCCPWAVRLEMVAFYSGGGSREVSDLLG